MVRGDTKNFKWQIQTQDGTPWVPCDADKIYFTVKKDYESPVAFQKIYPGSITYDSQTKYFETTVFPKDTNKLRFGEYVYDIEIVQDAIINIDKVVKTVSVGTFMIEKEVTCKRDEV